MFSLFKRKCNICKRTVESKLLRKYVNDKGKKIALCEQCTVYAERRAFRKAN